MSQQQTRKQIEATKAELRAQLKSIKTARLALEPGEFNPKLATSLNTCSKSLSLLSAEERQLDKGLKVAVINISAEDEDDVIMNRLSELSPLRRQKIALHLEELSEEEDSLLGHGS